MNFNVAFGSQSLHEGNWVNEMKAIITATKERR
jgi:hypothetical protein